MARQADIVHPAGRHSLLARQARLGKFDRAVLVLIVAGLLLTTASWLGARTWPFELITHFRFQFAVGGMVLLLFAAARRQAGTAVAALLLTAGSLWPLAPWLMPGAAAQAAVDGTRLLLANVRMDNRDYQAVLDLVAAENPDVVGLIEVDSGWVAALSALHGEYPYSVLRPAGSATGLALYSRLPLSEAPESPYVEEGIPTAIEMQLELPQGPATLILAHPLSPVTARRAAIRNRQLASLAAVIRADENESKILIGDLNTTQWSPYYADFERESGLVNAAAGYGYRPTWPSWGGVRLLQIPIDHCLLSRNLGVAGFRIGRRIGSDHLPVIVDLGVAEPATRASP